MRVCRHHATTAHHRTLKYPVMPVAPAPSLIPEGADMTTSAPPGSGKWYAGCGRVVSGGAMGAMVAVAEAAPGATGAPVWSRADPAK